MTYRKILFIRYFRSIETRGELAGAEMRPEIDSGIVTAGQLLAHFSPEVLICVRWLELDFFLFLKWRIEWPHFRIRFH